MPLDANVNRHLFGAPGPDETFAGLGDEDANASALRRIADRIAGADRAGELSEIPAGATYLAQFAAHDLDFRGRVGDAEQGRCDLGLVYGDGPKHDAFCYQLPERPGVARYMLRIGRTRPTRSSPAWGAARDLPRVACPHLDGNATEMRTEVLVPNAFSDSNALLAQFQTLWALLHNAVAGKLVETAGAESAFEQARAITRGIYHDAIRNDVLGTWLLPAFRGRYARRDPRRLSTEAATGVPAEFMAGVARLGHGMVRDIYALNDQTPMVGLRDILRHTGLGRPHDMPLTEDWLVDFSRFFAIGASVPQKARAIGPHVPRAFGNGRVAWAGVPAADALVLRDLVACTSRGVRSVCSLIASVRSVEPGLFEGWFAQDESVWVAALTAWLTEAGLSAEEAGRLAADPPLTLYLMLEAEADNGGRTLGALGSVILGETLSAGLPAPGADESEGVAEARKAVFADAAPTRMGEMIRFLQRHYAFAEGARLHPAGAASDQPKSSREGLAAMLDTQNVSDQPIPRIEVADYIEMGRLVAEWATGMTPQPETVQELRDQLQGIAVVPERIKKVSFVQSTLDHLVLRLPVKEMVEESMDAFTNPMANGGYPLPRFYEDFYRPGFAPVMTPLEMLYARVGDYTIAQCK